MLRLPDFALLSTVLIGHPVMAQQIAFVGSRAGDERQAVGIKLCWCPPGRFTMGSPPDEPETRGLLAANRGRVSFRQG